MPRNRSGTCGDGGPATEVIRIGQAKFIADPSGALWWPQRRTLVVADLHLEKGSSYARRGTFLPPYDSRATLTRLDSALRRHNVERLVLLGDSFHDTDAMHRLPNAEREKIAALQERFQWIWVTGNHDPTISDRLGGQVCDAFEEQGLVFRHEPGPPGTRGEIAGHLHPASRIVRHGRSIRRRCFVADGHRLILPAFGAYAGGLNVCDAAICGLFSPLENSNDLGVWMLGEQSVFRISPRELRAD